MLIDLNFFCEVGVVDHHRLLITNLQTYSMRSKFVDVLAFSLRMTMKKRGF